MTVISPPNGLAIFLAVVGVALDIDVIGVSIVLVVGIDDVDGVEPLYHV